jgi:hypothetical protein
VGINRIAETAKVLKHTIEKFVQMTTEVWKGFNQEARLYNSPGEDAVPCKGDQLILVKTDGTGKYAAVGVLTVSQGALPGEKIIYARDPDAQIVSKIAMLNDGTVRIEAEGDIIQSAKGEFTAASEKGVSLTAKENVNIAADKDMTHEAKGKNTVKGEDVELSGKVKASGGSFECAGTATPSGSGCLCAMSFCAFNGAAQTGSKAEGT